MTVAELAEKLNAEATRRGLTPEQLLEELAAQLPSGAAVPSTPGGKRKLAFAGIGASTSGRTARDADEMLAEGFGRD